MNRKPRPKNSESYSPGHEYTIDHLRRDIFVRRVAFMGAGVGSERTPRNELAFLLPSIRPPFVAMGIHEFRQSTQFARDVLCEVAFDRAAVREIRSSVCSSRPSSSEPVFIGAA